MYEEEKQELKEKMEERFEIIEKCGEGDFGFVWEAKYLKPSGDIPAGTRCAIKQPHSFEKKVNEMFEREARAGINHENVVRIYEVVRVGFENYLVMELCKKSLDYQLKTEKR